MARTRGTARVMEPLRLDGEAKEVEIRICVWPSRGDVVPEDADRVQIQLAQFRAAWPDGNLRERNGVWVFPLSREDVRRIAPGKHYVQATVSQGKSVSVTRPTWFHAASAEPETGTGRG